MVQERDVFEHHRGEFGAKPEGGRMETRMGGGWGVDGDADGGW